ncbi:MAG: hypothetical protein RBR53_08145 [Desulforegulaceae bacterium]|nr:hypothetical protein [Desulforegulaceae bacterium]
MKILKKQKVILFLIILSGVSGCNKPSKPDSQTNKNTNPVSYIYYHENKPLESDLIVKIQSSGKVSSIIKKLKPFSQNPHSFSSWEKFEETIFIDNKTFFELTELLKKIGDNGKMEKPPFPGQPIIDLKICFNNLKCKNFRFFEENKTKNFNLFREKLNEDVLKKFSFF